MSVKKTLSDFIITSNSVHGQYDYSKSNYKNNHTKVVITCTEHGDFEQRPKDHIKGNGCPKCAKRNYKYSTTDFINKANMIHKFRYLYDKTIYLNAKTKITITCREHGYFNQLPYDHINGTGCPICSGNIKSDTNTFVKKANITHNYKYNYDKVIYINNYTPIIITCNIHGDFKQTPINHLNGCGCVKCAGNLKSNTKDFITKANIVHNKYIYNKILYKNAYTKVIITCPEHGDFLQTPTAHLSGQGCPKCVSNISYIGSRWLDSLGIPDDIKHREVKKLIPGRRFIVDGFDPETNTVYEFYGDEVHGNPNVYHPDTIGPYGKTYGELYVKTIERENIFKKSGFNLIIMWECDFRKQLLYNFVSK